VIELGDRERAGGDFKEPLGVGTVGAFDLAVEFGGARRQKEEAQAPHPLRLLDGPSGSAPPESPVGSVLQAAKMLRIVAVPAYFGLRTVRRLRSGCSSSSLNSRHTAAQLKQQLRKRYEEPTASS
jgi:hypothetical protein